MTDMSSVNRQKYLNKKTVINNLIDLNEKENIYSLNKKTAESRY